MLRWKLPKVSKPDMKLELYRIYIFQAFAYASIVWYPTRDD